MTSSAVVVAVPEILGWIVIFPLPLSIVKSAPSSRTIFPVPPSRNSTPPEPDVKVISAPSKSKSSLSKSPSSGSDVSSLLDEISST